MIQTKFGSEIKILKAEINSTKEFPDFTGWVKVKRLSDGAIREWHISELKANGGYEEILSTMKKVLTYPIL